MTWDGLGRGSVLMENDLVCGFGRTPGRRGWGGVGFGGVHAGVYACTCV